MPKRYSSKDITKALEREGFVFISQKGSHAKYVFNGAKKRTVIVPVGKKPIPVGTFQSILRQSGLAKQDFEK
ncbi:MAG: type II toxin-antitoxin system HicA family toxin [Candidatus Paceibacterota bacterium]